MIRSSSQASQSLAVKVGSCIWITTSEEAELSKSFRYSLPCCCLRRIHYLRYILVFIALFGCVYYKINTIELNIVKSLRATVNRYVIGFELKSTAFKDGHSIPSKYNTTFSPPLQWMHQPSSTQSYALIVEDIDTKPNHYKHWILYNIPSSVSELTEGILVWPTGANVLRNDYKHYRYDGPLPKDGKKHHYVFRLYALSVKKMEEIIRMKTYIKLCNHLY